MSKSTLAISVVLFLSVMCPARADPVVYMATQFNGPAYQFGTIDLSTGVFSQIGADGSISLAGLGLEKLQPQALRFSLRPVWALSCIW